MQDKQIIIITNNPKIKEDYANSKEYELIFLLDRMQVLKKARDLIHLNWILINHTMVANIPIYKHPYRTLALKQGKSLHTDSLLLIERSIEKLASGQLPNYDEKVMLDFQDMDRILFKEVKL